MTKLKLFISHKLLTILIIGLSVIPYINTLIYYVFAFRIKNVIGRYPHYGDYYKIVPDYNWFFITDLIEKCFKVSMITTFFSIVAWLPVVLLTKIKMPIIIWIIYFTGILLYLYEIFEDSFLEFWLD